MLAVENWRRNCLFGVTGCRILISAISVNRYALLGAASFLGGSMRMTVSLCVIMVEITNNLQLLPLIMLVLLISKAVGDAFNNGFYEEQVKLRSLPLLDSRPQRFMRNLAAKDAVSTRKVGCVLFSLLCLREFSNMSDRCFEVT